MNPVVGLDVAKGETEGQMFLHKGKPHGRHFSIVHTADGFAKFHEVLEGVEALAGAKPTVILESTGHYHDPVVRFLEEHSYVYIVVNPLISHQAKKSSLRKVKTDAIDAYRLCELIYKEEFEPLHKHGMHLSDLRIRQRDAVTSLFIQTKLQFHAVLDLVFPEYRGVFGDLFSKVSLNTLQAFPTPEAVLQLSETEIGEKVKTLCKSRSESWATRKAQDIIQAANRSPFHTVLLSSHLFSLKMYIQMILEYKEHLSDLENQIDALAEQIEECQIVQSIPEIGETIAATIISEIGEIERFDHPKKLVAFAGVDPSVHSSGKFTPTINRITKRGSSRLRHALYLAALCSLRKTGSKRLQAFYKAKREEGKAHKVALVACINKLLHWIYAVLKSHEPFVDLE